MTAAEIAALRPAAGAASSEIRAAIARVEVARDEHAAAAAEIENGRRDRLLMADDRAVAAADQKAAASRLMVERLTVLLPLLHEDLAAALGRETVAQLQAEVEEAARAARARDDWTVNSLPKVWALIGEGFQLEDAAAEAHAKILNNVRDAYERREVREAGPLGVQLPDLPAAGPRAIFTAWARGNWKP